MGGPVDFFRGLVGASPSPSPSKGSGRVRSKQVGRYGHRTAEAVEGKPILKESKEYFIARAEKLEKQAGRLRTDIAKEPKLKQAQNMRAQAKKAKTNAQLHSEKQLEQTRNRRAERERAKQTGPLDQIKKAVGHVVDTVRHEAEEILHDASEGIRWFDRKIEIADEEQVLKNLIKKRDKIKWYQHPVDSFNLWWDIREQKAKIETLKQEDQQ